MNLIMMLPLIKFLLCLLFLSMSNLAIKTCKARNQQGEYLFKLIQSKRSHQKNNPYSQPHEEELLEGVMNDQRNNYDFSSKVFVDDEKQEYYYGRMEDDKVKNLPGEPYGVDFDQYAGYVTVDAKAGRALFYYFVESPLNSSSKPLVLWLNGGPGCSSLGYGAMQELGPFRVKTDGKTLYRNQYAWNNVANVIFLESPAGVGFSYSNTSSDYIKTGDKSTALDSYFFLLNWLQRFPHYKSRDFFITGESYGGHYVPQLAEIILENNKMMKNNHTVINLKGIAVGNGWIDDNLCSKGMYDYFWTHGLNSDETHSSIETNCDFESGNLSTECNKYINIGDVQVQNLNIYNIYAPICDDDHATTNSSDGDFFFDPCSEDHTSSYLNLAEVQKALHANATKWYGCSAVGWTDSPASILPTISRLISNGISIWIYSGDIDGRVPITSSRYSINALKLPVETAWRPWYLGNEIGGYVVGYEGLTLVTVRGAGHMVPTNQPKRALTMISSFLRGELPPQN